MYNTYAPIIDEYNGKVLGLGAAAYINAPYNYSFSFFPAGTRYGDVAHEFDEWLKAQGLLQHSKVADVRPVDWKATLDYDTERRAKSGIETVYTYLYTRGQVEDYTPIIQAAVAAGADAFVSSCIIPDGPLLGSQMKASNLMSKFKYIWLMGLGLYKAQYYAAGGKEIYEGVFCNTYPPEELFPAVKEVCDKVRVRLALKPTDAVEFGAVTYYTIVMALKKAIEETGTLNADAIKNYFLSVDYMDPRIGRIKFFKDAELQQSQKTHWQQTSEAAMYLAQQQNGTLQVVWPLNIRTAEPIYPYPYS
jgi:branched-chain amino acid transport system substrate-binding protein